MLEICVDTIASSLEGKKGGADRLELCESISVGGLTPSYGKIYEVRKIKGIQLNILIRPKAGNFCYSEEEIRVIKKDIEMCAKLNCDGIVVGVLTESNEIDMASNKELIELAHKNGLSCTFHRAFDICNNQSESLEKIISLGFDRILTSGGERTAMEGIDNIKSLIKQSKDRIIIMPASGIDETNIEIIIKRTMAKEIHGSFSKTIVEEENKKKANSFFNQTNPLLQTDAKKVSAAKSILNALL